MATYKTYDLLKQLHEILDNGYPYVDIYESEADEELPAALSFEVTDGFAGIDYGEVEACEIPDEFDEDTPEEYQSSDPCFHITFSYEELFSIIDAVDASLKYYKVTSDNKSLSRDERDKMKSASIKCRNLQAKLKRFSNTFRIKD